MLWALVILILCGIPGRDIPHISFLELLSFDKFVHAGIFFVLLLLTVRGFVLQDSYPVLKERAKLMAAIICISYGGLLEIMQATVFEERSADVFDFIANSFGCLLGTLVYGRVEKIVLMKLIK
ncbi:MAG: putative integral rane protein [Bacteroidetes bacterium]|nr:putative integral rane protein [Bacteroidota bacterium]